MSPIHAITPPEPTWEDRKRLTAEAMADPQRGDEFTEMFSTWVIVTERNDDRVKWSSGQGPTDDFFRDFPPRETSVAEFRHHHAYKSSPGFWVTINRRDTLP